MKGMNYPQGKYGIQRLQKGGRSFFKKQGSKKEKSNLKSLFKKGY